MKSAINLFIVMVMLAGQATGIFAQESVEKSRKSEQKELQEQQSRQEQQMKMLQEIMRQNMEAQRKALEKMREGGDQQESSERAFFYGSYRGQPGPYREAATSLKISKRMKKANIAQNYGFTIDSLTAKISINVISNCQSGKVTIQLYSPQKKMINSITVNPSENISWSQTFRLVTPEDEKKYVGNWFFRVFTQDADGVLVLSVTTY